MSLVVAVVDVVVSAICALQFAFSSLANLMAHVPHIGPCIVAPETERERQVPRAADGPIKKRDRSLIAFGRRIRRDCVAVDCVSLVYYYLIIIIH